MAETMTMPEERRENGLKVVRFTNWKEFRSYQDEGTAPDTIFRGQRDPIWTLQSLWDRKIAPVREHIGPDRPIESAFVDGGYEASRDRFLKHFKDYARRFPEVERSSLESDNGWWAFGRHYGLVSPLLDWTRNPLVGAFFAFIDFAGWFLAGDPTPQVRNERKQQVSHVAVWALDCSGNPFRNQEFELVEGQPGFETRQKAQEGVFTRLSDGRHFDVQSYLSDRGLMHDLCRYEVPSAVAGTALNELHDQDVHYAKLFPDVWGAAMYANTREFVKPESLSELVED
jgi:hypothetical protein